MQWRSKYSAAEKLGTKLSAVYLLIYYNSISLVTTAKNVVQIICHLIVL